MVPFLFQQYCSCVWWGIVTDIGLVLWAPLLPKLIVTDGMSCSYICAQRKSGQWILAKSPIAPLIKPFFTLIYDLNITLALRNISNSAGRQPALMMSVGIILHISTASMLGVHVASTNLSCSLIPDIAIIFLQKRCNTASCCLVVHCKNFPKRYAWLSVIFLGFNKFWTGYWK